MTIGRITDECMTVSHLIENAIIFDRAIPGTQNTTGIPLGIYEGEIFPKAKDILKVEVNQDGHVIKATMFQRGGGYLNQGSI